MSHADIESVMKENRLFESPPEFREKANLSSLEEYQRMYRQSLDEPEKFWKEVSQSFKWFKDWEEFQKWQLPNLQSFVGGKTNISVNCLDRHLEAHGDKTALLFESEKAQVQTYSYRELYEKVCQLANLLKKQGIQKGDRVAVYMPMIPEAVISMLACARIGAVHSVVFGGFSSQALAERIQDAECKAVITADGGYRRGKIIELKQAVDEALENCPSVKDVFVFRWTEQDVNFKKGRDLWVNDLIADQSTDCPPEELESEHPLFILYTSGSTGKPKGVLHSTAGYMLHAGLTTKYVFDIKEDDLYWCSADVGWITGHSYVTYGPLLNAASVFIYEGAPNFPEPDRFWKMIDRHQVSIFYTAPTAIRAFMKWGEDWLENYKLKSLRLLGTVGEPINPEAWIWYHHKIGKGNCPIVDTWWQTETGGIMITTLPGIHLSKPGSAGLPLFGVEPAIVNHDGEELGPNEGGFLVLKRPWPSMMRSIYKDEERFKEQYWSQVPGVYFAGDGARKDEDGYFWIMGRIDDVVNVSGHRLGTAEIESALVGHNHVCEAAVVGVSDDVKGERIVAFVILEEPADDQKALVEELSQHVANEIGSIARPSEIRITDNLPKTRSGKIMRRLLRAVAAGDTSQQDTSTLEDQSILEKLRGDEA